jgi:hypothetical protein
MAVTAPRWRARVAVRHDDCRRKKQPAPGELSGAGLC